MVMRGQWTWGGHMPLGVRGSSDKDRPNLPRLQLHGPGPQPHPPTQQALREPPTLKWPYRPKIDLSATDGRTVHHLKVFCSVTLW